MRIAYLASQYPATSHTFIRREVAALRERGLDVSTFSIRQPGENERTAPDERAEFERTWYVLPPRADLVRAHARAAVHHPGRYARTLVDALKHRVPGSHALLYAVLYFGESIYLAERMRDEGIEHLHNHFANNGANVGFLASRYLGIPWSVTLHGISEFDYPAGLLLQQKLQHAEFAACVAHFIRAQAMRTIEPDHWAKLFINRCSVEASKIRSAQRTRATDARLRILCVARLSPEKGLYGLIDAFKQIVDRGVDAELRLVGDGPDQEKLADRIEALGLSERCSMPGRVSEAEVAGEVANADIFAMGSFMEGLPVVLMEALALGVPAVAPRVAGIPELVEHDVTGLLYSPSHWDELSDCLERLAKDPALRKRLGEQGKQRVDEEFDVTRAVEPIVERFATMEARKRLVPPEQRSALGRAKRVARDAMGRGMWASRRSQPRVCHADKLSVVTFHRVLPDHLRSQYPFPRLAVTPGELAWFLAYFSEHYTCETLARAHERFQAGDRPQKPLLAVTFDDGQLDNFEHGLPVLARAGIQASFFVPTGHVQRSEPIWHDRLGFIALTAQRTAEGRARLDALLSRWSLRLPPGERPLDALTEAVKALDPEDRAELIDQLERDVPPNVPAWAKLMTPGQIRAVRDAGHEVGSHTVNHVLLPQCKPDERERELVQSRTTLEEWLDQPVASFCYPNGDSDAASADAVERAGYVRAVTTRFGANAADASAFELGRFDLDPFEVRDQLRSELSASLLAFRLSGAFPGL